MNYIINIYSSNEFKSIQDNIICIDKLIDKVTQYITIISMSLNRKIISNKINKINAHNNMHVVNFSSHQKTR